MISLRLSVSRLVLCSLAPIFLLACAARAQTEPTPTEPEPNALPIYTGFQIPTVNGTLRYSVSASERETLGYDGGNGNASSTNVTANFGFITPSKVHPLSLTYSGGYLANTTGQPSSFFHQLAIGQQLTLKHWSFDVSNHFNYLPDTPSTGLAGLAGLGDLGASAAAQAQEALTPFDTRIEETAIGTAARRITGSTAVSGTVYFSAQRFLHTDYGIQSNALVLSPGLSHRVDARTELTLAYRYIDFTYLNSPATFTVNAATLQLRRKLTRKVDVDLAGGPQRIGGSTVAAPRYTYLADARITYQGSEQHGLSAGAAYSRSTNGGSGIAFGAITDTVSGTLSRRLNRSLGVTAQFNFGRSTGLQQVTALPISSATIASGLQVNQALTRTLSAFFSYSALQQSYSGIAQGISPVNGISQILGFGLTYSPNLLRLGRQ
jgi:hypothetical protein